METNGIVKAEQLARAKIAVNSYMSKYSIERDLQLGAQSSIMYGGARDIYSVVGYPRQLYIEDYLGRYQRDSLAYRIVTAAPDDTWRKPFKMLDGKTLEDGEADTEFVNEWNQLAQFDSLESDLLDDSRRSLWHYFYDVDRQCGIGQFAVMVLGFADVSPDTINGFETPLKQNKGGKLLYLHVANEYSAKIYQEDLVKDPANLRFGLPEFYRVDFRDGKGLRKVHYSRCIHVAEGGVLYGKPRLEAIYNRLVDVEKLLAASGEAGWRAITRKIIVSTKDGYQLAEGTVSTDKINDMIHGLRDVVELEGMDVNVVSGEIIDPTGAITNQLSMISAGTDIPVRILVGSERGNLASSQDEKHWNDNIQSRRTQFVEPTIIRPFVKRMIYAGILPYPQSGAFCMDWPSLYETDDATQAQTFLTYTQGITQLAGQGVERVVKPQEVVKYFVRGLPADAVPTEQELAQMDADALAKQQAAMEMMQQQQPQDGQATPVGTQPADKQATDKQPVAANSYGLFEQAAMLEAAARILAEA